MTGNRFAGSILTLSGLLAFILGLGAVPLPPVTPLAIGKAILGFLTGLGVSMIVVGIFLASEPEED